MNEMNDSFDGDLGEPVASNISSRSNISSSSSNSSRSSWSGMKNDGPALKIKKKKAKAVSPTTAKKKSFAKKDESLKDRPKRSLTAYNIFFASQRKKLLQETPVRPTGKPRKSHGKVGFSEMAKIIGAKWKDINPQDRLYYDHLAAKDKCRYNMEMGDWTKNGLKQKARIAEEQAVHQPVEDAVARPISCQSFWGGNAPFGMNSIFSSIDPLPDHRHHQQRQCSFYTSTTAVSAFDDTLVVPLKISSSVNMPSIIEPSMLQRQANDEARARDYLRRLQQASFSTEAPPASAVAHAGENTNLSKNASLAETDMKQSYEAMSPSTMTTFVNMYNRNSSSNKNTNNYCNQNLDNLNDNNTFEPIPLADAQSCHAITPPHYGMTAVPYDSNNQDSEFFHHLARNMDEDSVDLLVDMFRPSNQQAARAHRHRQQQPQLVHNAHQGSFTTNNSMYPQ